MKAMFEVRIETHREALLRAALKLCHGNEALAEDMVQETYLKALLHQDRFAPDTNLQAWLLRILYNAIMSTYRHRQVAKEGPYPEGFDPADAAKADTEVSDEILQAVRDLPEDHREIFLMAAMEDSPYQAIADKLGIPVGTVMSRLWRARRSLKQRLTPVSLN